jgi:hypothetical protein
LLFLLLRLDFGFCSLAAEIIVYGSPALVYSSRWGGCALGDLLAGSQVGVGVRGCFSASAKAQLER